VVGSAPEVEVGSAAADDPPRTEVTPWSPLWAKRSSPGAGLGIILTSHPDETVRVEAKPRVYSGVVSEGRLEP
jgi:hypothetical protein